MERETKVPVMMPQASLSLGGLSFLVDLHQTTVPFLAVEYKCKSFLDEPMINILKVSLKSVQSQSFYQKCCKICALVNKL